MAITLPNTSRTSSDANLFSDVYENDKVLKEAVEALEATKKAVTWYTPKIIATEETRENTAFGTLTTPDEITGVVVPEGGILRAGYLAVWKSSVSEAARAAFTLNKFGIATPFNANVETPFGGGTAFRFLSTSGISSGGRILSTGVETSASGGVGITFVDISGLAAGTYNVAIEFRATSGSVTVKERKLWVEVHGT